MLALMSPQDPEMEALAALDRGDRKAALAVLMDAYGTAVYRFCRGLVAAEEVADDVHQMTFVQAWEGLERFSRRSSLRTWLFSIARHRCLDALKMSRRRRARFEAVADPPETAAPDNAEADLEASFFNRMLKGCLGELAPAARTAVVLRYQEELSYPEIARVCGERPPTLQARVARALPALRRCLERHGASL